MHDDEEPRIIAEGRWSQDEFGDVTYMPEHVRPMRDDEDPADDRPASAPRPPHAELDGYRIRSDDTWDAARRDYLAGDTAGAVCARYDLREGTLRHRAAREGWRRGDAPDPDPVDLEAETAGGLPDLGDMARHVMVRLDRAVRRGRAAEAASWLRIWRSLTDPGLGSAVLRLARAPNPAPAPDPLDAMARDLREVEALARAAAAQPEDDAAGHAAVETRLAALRTRAAGWAISDDSDDSDPVFSGPGSETGPSIPEGP